MDMLTSLFKDEKSSGNERLHYSWLRDDFPESEYIVYPNVALQVIIDSEYPGVNQELDDGKAWVQDPDYDGPPPWSTRNFFEGSSVDLCVIRKSNYLAQIAVEIDGPCHANVERRKRDEFKTLLFDRAGIPLVRLKLYGDDAETEEASKWVSLEAGIERFNVGPHGGVESPIDIRGRKAICAENLREYFELLNRVFSADEYVVFPNVALQSIFTDKVQLKYSEDKDRRQRGLVDFCVFDANDLLPLIAFRVTGGGVWRLCEVFGLPLVDLNLCLQKVEDRGSVDPSSPVGIARLQRTAGEALQHCEKVKNEKKKQSSWIGGG